MFPCKYHQNGGFSMAMLVLGRVNKSPCFLLLRSKFLQIQGSCILYMPCDAPMVKGQLGVPLTVYPWYLLCSLGILGDYNP